MLLKPRTHNMCETPICQTMHVNDPRGTHACTYACIHVGMHLHTHPCGQHDLYAPVQSSIYALMHASTSANLPQVQQNMQPM